MALMKVKRLRLAGFELAVATDIARAERISQSLPYRHLLRPAIRSAKTWLAQRAARPGHEGNDAAALPPTVPPPPPSPEAADILNRIAGQEWYHTLELPHGVVTPGFVDHRAQVPLYGLPADMRGLRALDVATFDGFWAFEMERRGAQVVAVDLASLAECDYPRRFRDQALSAAAQRKTGAGFALAKELLGSQVERRLLSVYDLSPDKVGTFDLVFVSDLLLHLRDPARALESVCSVVRPGGSAIIAEPYHVDLEAFGDAPLSQFGYLEAVGWWHHSVATLKGMMWFAGFETIEELVRFRLQTRSPVPLHKVVLKASVHPVSRQVGAGGRGGPA